MPNAAVLAGQGMEGLYEGKHETPYIDATGTKHQLEFSDRLQLKKLDASHYQLGIEIAGKEGEGCSMNGPAIRTGNVFEYRYDTELSGPRTACVLKVKVEGMEARIDDVRRRCEILFCDKRGILDGEVFVRNPGVTGLSLKEQQRELNWETLDRGLELGEYQWKPSVGADSSMFILRADPKYWALEGYASNGDSLVTEDWMRKLGLTAAFNAGMFAVDHQAHIGFSSPPKRSITAVSTSMSRWLFTARKRKAIPCSRLLILTARRVSAGKKLREITHWRRRTFA